MKKLLVMFLVGVMAISMVGCGESEEEIKGTLTDNQTVQQEEEDVSVMDALGETAATVYENDYLGIGFNLPTDWTFYTQEQINEMNGIVQETLDDEIAKKLEEASAVYDMMAMGSTGNNVNVVFEKIGALQNAIHSEKDYAESSQETTKTALEQIGCTDVNIEVGNVNFAGEEHAAIITVSNMNGVKLYQKGVCLKQGSYFVVVTVTAFNEDLTDDILANFYALSK